MGVKRCAVNGCLSTSSRKEDVGVTFHQLPSNLATRAIWLAAAKVPDEANVKVCSRHFREADFKLVNQKYFLIKGLYPTIFPWGIYTREEAAAASHDAKATDVAASKSVSKPEPLPVPESSSSSKKQSISPGNTAVDKIQPPVDNQPKRKSTENVVVDLPNPMIGSSVPAPTAAVAKKECEVPPKKVDPIPGTEISAMDFQNVWHKAKILEVDSLEREVLIHYEDDNQQKLVDEWIPMASSRLRPLTEPLPSPTAAVEADEGAASQPAAVEPRFKVNEKCMARWSDSRKFKATVKGILPNGLYEVLFDDGYLKTVKLKHMSKLKSPRTPVKQQQKTPRLPVVNLVGGEEWYCQWVDDCPLGLSVTLEGVPSRVRVIKVDDLRLPAGWTKYFSERLHGGSKWDVLVISPQGRRFRGRQDVRAFIEETADTTLNLADFDFAMHKKRAKEKGVYTYTDAYRKLLKALYPSMTEIDIIPPTPPDIQEMFMSQQPAMLTEPLVYTAPPDWIMVDGMKVQIVDNLLRCPEEGCLKNFRKENLLKMHIKHYHEAMAKRISATPTMTDLAAKRQSLVEEETRAAAAKEGVAGISPPKPVKRSNADKVRTTPDSSFSEAVAVKEELEEEAAVGQPASILHQVLSSGSLLRPEGHEGHERPHHQMYPKATPITSTGKRKYVRKVDAEAPKFTKKLKMEAAADADESLSLAGDVAQQREGTPVKAHPQHYINEHGELIKIVRMRKEEIINCLCHYPEEDGLMIQCDLCLCWQHGRCNDIEKESQVPEKYVCYICRNPERGRASMKYVHDQDWLLDGKLPRSTYHTQGTRNDAKRCETLKRINTLTGNLLELKRLMHSLQVKMSIADNKDHPKLYLWSKRWEEAGVGDAVSPQKGLGRDQANDLDGPKPEAAISTKECQRRLMEHIRNVQAQLNQRLDTIEKYVDEIEAQEGAEGCAAEKEDDAKCTPQIKQTIHMMMEDLATMQEIAMC